MPKPTHSLMPFRLENPTNAVDSSLCWETSVESLDGSPTIGLAKVGGISIASIARCVGGKEFEWGAEFMISVGRGSLL